MALRPGADLDEASLVTRFGVSRTPVREALIRLSAEGLVEIRPNRGATVSLLDVPTLRAIFEASDFLERACIRLACVRRTDEDIERLEAARQRFEQALAAGDVPGMVEANTQFHLGIAAAGANKYFTECYRRLLADHERIAQLWYTDTLSRDDRLTHKRIGQQHAALVAAIREGDLARAEQVTLEHADLCKDGIYTLLGSGVDLLADLTIEARAD